MNDLLKNSLLCRWVSAVAAWCSKTPMARGLAALRRVWCASLIYRFLHGRVTSEPATFHSGLLRYFTRFNGRLSRSSYRVLLHQSLLYRIYSAVFGFFLKSVLLRPILKGGFSRILLLLFAAYWPIDFALREVLAVPMLSSSWDELLLVISTVWVLHQRANAKKPLPTRLCGADLSLGFYLLIGIGLLVFTRTYFSVNLSGFRATMQYLLCFFLVLRLLQNEGDFDMMIRALILFATVFALHGIYQYIVATPIPENWTDNAEQAVRTRAFSIFKNPNILAAYLVLFAPVAIGAAYASETPAKKLLLWACGLLMCLACLFTMSRGAWIGLVIAAIFFIILVDRRLLLLLFVGGVVACFVPFVRSRIMHMFSDSFWEASFRGGRIKRWETALGYVKADGAWVGGLGYGIYGGAIAVQNPIDPMMEYMYVDNYYVKLIAENGLVGISTFFVGIGGLFLTGFKSIARAAGRKPICVGLLAGMLGNLVQSCFESLWEEPYMMALFFISGALLVFGGLFLPAQADKQTKETKGCAS